VSEITDLMDGEKLTVSFRQPKGVEVKPDEEIFVRRIPICDMDGLGKAWGKPKAEVAIYTDRPADWVARLSEDSFIAVMNKGRQLNFTSFQTWFRWQADTLKAMGQGGVLDKVLGDAMEKLKAEQQA
jgi:hypothetical protein